MAPGGGNQVFGQTMKKKASKSSAGSRYQKQFGNGNKGGSKSNPSTVYRSASNNNDDGSDPAAARRRFKQQQGQEIDKRFGYEKFALSANNNIAGSQSTSRRGWLFQMLPTTVRNHMNDRPIERSTREI
jgi:hypothetical protein